MAKAGGGLFRLDAICAKLKQNKLATNSSTGEDEASSSLPSKDHEANNNIGGGEDVNGSPVEAAGVDDDAAIEDDTAAILQSELHTDSRDSAQFCDADNCSNDQNGATYSVLGEFDSYPTCSPSHDTSLILEADGSRRSRRKNQRPRNIVQYQDQSEITKENEELEDYVMNNKNVDFDAAQDDDEQSINDDAVLDLSSGRPSERGSYDADTMVDEPDDQDQDTNLSTDDFGAIDLSISKSKPRKNASCSTGQPDVALVSDRDDMSSQSSDLSSSAGSRGKPVSDNSKPSSHQPPNKPQGINSTEAAEIKHYAENTMNELLNMYGLQDDNEEGTSIASNVPLQNFASRSILERQKVTGGPIPESINAALKAKLIPKIAHAHQGASSMSQGYSGTSSSRASPSTASTSSQPPAGKSYIHFLKYMKN